MTDVKNAEEVVLTSKQKIRKYTWLAICLLSVLSVVGVMLAFYSQPDTIDGVANASQLWGLTDYGPFFQQFFSTTVWLGFGSFALGAVFIMSAAEIGSTVKRTEVPLIKEVSMICVAFAAVLCCATPFIFLVGGIMLVVQIVSLVLGLTNISFEGE